MLDQIPAILDRLIALIDRRKDQRKRTFTELIEPLFLQMTDIHVEYITTLQKIFSSLRRTDEELEIHHRQHRG